jgi:ribose/xylose/arabinose/galactoside ABC-type transport system permease subunit
MMRALAQRPSFTSLVTVGLLIVLMAAGGFAYPGFLSVQVLCNLLIDNAYLLVVAIGMTFVILSGGIDLSVGSVLALTTIVAAWLLHVAIRCSSPCRAPSWRCPAASSRPAPPSRWPCSRWRRGSPTTARSVAPSTPSAATSSRR